jgi:hypothetical protein
MNSVLKTQKVKIACTQKSERLEQEIGGTKA